MEWAAYVALALGVCGQLFLKAPKKVNNWIAFAALFAVGFVGYVLSAPIPVHVTTEWVRTGVMFTLGPAGLASVLGTLGILPKTDSL